MRLARANALGLLTLGALLVAAIGVYILAAPDTPHRPDFTLTDLRGEPRAVSEFDGDVLVINFWASWCAPCRKEIPMLIAAQNDYDDQGLQIIGVAVDTRGAASEFADRYNINYPVLVDPIAAARVQDDYTDNDTPAGVLPYTVVVDRDARIAARLVGLVDRDRLDELVRPLLAQPAAGPDG